MPEKPKIAELSASITATGGAAYSPQGLRCELSVNSFPVVTADVAIDAGADVTVKSPLSSEVLSHIGSLQKARIAGRTDTDFTMTASDGIGGTLDFSGFISAPVLEITKYNVGNRISAIGEAAMLDSLDLSIYDAGYATARTETAATSGSQLDPIPSAEDGNITGTLDAVTKVLTGNFETLLSGETLDISKELMQLQHDVNKGGPLEIWTKILKANDVKFDSWPSLLALHPTIGSHLSMHVKDILTSYTPGFWNKMWTLMSTFQMYYVPEFEGLGKLVRSDEKVAKPDGTIEISAAGLTVTDGSPRLLQPGGVVMTGGGYAAYRQETDTNNPRVPRVVAFAPSPLLPGFIQRESIPFWLLREDGVTILGSEVDSASGGAGGNANLDLDLEARKKRRKDGVEFKDKVDSASAGVMSELCAIIFKELQLASATASASIPLDFGVNDKIGKRVNVKINGPGGESGGQFEAFVAGVAHNLDLRQGKQMNSSTTLSFTHAKFS